MWEVFPFDWVMAGVIRNWLVLTVVRWIHGSKLGKTDPSTIIIRLPPPSNALTSEPAAEAVRHAPGSSLSVQAPGDVGAVACSPSEPRPPSSLLLPPNVESMPILIGVVLALAVCTSAAAIRMDRDRALYPAMVAVVASYYVLFAVMGGGARVISVEVLIAAVFVIAGSLGFRRNLWIAAAALVAHGLMDAVHGRLVSNPGVPVWWPGFCGAYDVTAGVFLAWVLTRQSISRPQPQTVRS